jgi:hypothetical protein
MNKYTIIPSGLRYKGAPSIDEELSLTLQEQSQELTEYDRTTTLNLAQIYDNERQESTIFRPTFKITYLYDNTYTGTTTYITATLQGQNKVVFGEGFHNIMNLIFIDLM